MSLPTAWLVVLALIAIFGFGPLLIARMFADRNPAGSGGPRGPHAGGRVPSRGAGTSAVIPLDGRPPTN